MASRPLPIPLIWLCPMAQAVSRLNSSDSAPVHFTAQGRHNYSHSGQRILRWNSAVVNTVQEQG